MMFAVATLALAASFCVRAQAPVHLEGHDTSPIYRALLSRLSLRIIHPYLRPVHIFLQTNENAWDWKGSGTLLLDSRGKPYRIITVGHIFGKNYPTGYHWYQVMVPRENVVHEIAEAQPWFGKTMESKKIEEDVAILTPGPKRLISAFSSHRGGTANEERQVVMRPLSVMLKKDLTSLLTGERVPILGEGWIINGNGFFVLGYESFPGESGSGFINDQGGLYILSGFSPVDKEILKTLPESKRYRRVSFASAVLIDFPK
ncbi:MAG: hypothetical protein Q7S05_01375 [bacterium]|nr:hypothetical protein [bacterium]